MAYYEVFRRMQAVVWNRKLIRTEIVIGTHESERPLGLGPAETQANDWVYIVDGCSVPLVLRQAPAENNPQADNEDTYTLIGECYINNMMEGRAMDGITRDDWRDLKIK